MGMNISENQNWTKTQTMKIGLKKFYITKTGDENFNLRNQNQNFEHSTRKIKLHNLAYQQCISFIPFHDSIHL